MPDIVSVIVLSERLDAVKRKICNIDCKLSRSDHVIINPKMAQGVSDLEKLVSDLETELKEKYPEIGVPFRL